MQPSTPSDANGESRKHFYQLAWVRYASLFMILFILVGFWLYSETLISSIESLRSELHQTRLALIRQQEIVNILSSRSLSVHQLRGTDPRHSGVVLLDQSTGAAALKTVNLPPTENGVSYHAWAVIRHQPFPAGSFSIDSSSAEPAWITFTLDSSLRTPDSFLVSLESGPRAEHPSRLILLDLNSPGL